ncbi:MAG: hypothetical protein JWQ81_6908 [Amycolatopsis sp.]|uniref:ATP-binding protein n=1 Tax=Amycolatopsis sp. TaxID=37632 RepID=UPI0026227C13|nr:sensor histidine kinase [Amycolatopsis sp.]MCU1686169.1 hypothetical protein [Amycolatopsis sp.]
MWRSRTLASRILVGVLAILLLTMSLGGILYVTLTGNTLDQQSGTDAVNIAGTVAQIPEVRDAVERGDPGHIIEPLAQQVQASTHAAYVVVTDRTGLRFSHPNAALIGRRLEEPVAVLDGQKHIGIDPGSLGRSANGKAPIVDASGAVVGQVSVGILEWQVAGQLHRQALTIALYTALALAIGIVASLVLARAIKRVTFGLELSEITSLLQEREAMLHGIREGVLGVDPDGRVNVINDEARRLLRIRSAATGEHLDALIPAGRLHDLLSGTIDGDDEVVLTDESLLLVNRMPVALAGRDLGYVVTLRDRTELEALVRELHAVTGLTTALRAQEHEFANRLHVVSGLLDLAGPEEAASYLSELTHASLAPAEDLRARIGPPVLAALLVAKMAIASEQDVQLVVTPESHLDQPAVDVHALLTIVGNLVDNALDALGGQPQPRRVTVHLSDADAGLRVLVTDTGPGVPAEAVEEVFVDGYSTKAPRGQLRRGLGLALVHRIVLRAGGSIEVSPGPGARFDVRLPVAGAGRSQSDYRVAGGLR